MLNWVLMMIGLVLGAGAFHNPLHQVEHPPRHHHRHPNRQQIVYQAQEEANEFQIATDCNVSGTWYNSLGSELIMNVTETGQIVGEFRTAVERGRGSAGTGPGLVSGWTSKDGSRKALGFTVLWRDGASVTAWTGLCHVCNGIELMKTTWILTHEVDSCDEHWSSNRIGQDEFTRFEQAPGPRSILGINTPSDMYRAAQEIREGILSQAQQEPEI